MDALLERAASWMMDRGYATGHGDTIEDLLGELEWQAWERGQRGLQRDGSVAPTGEAA